MAVLNGIIAIGTQLKVERPGKGALFTPCDELMGPTVKLKDGSVLYLDSYKQAVEVDKDIEEILYIGDSLIDYGDFFDRAHTLMPAGYCEEWWAQELEKAAVDMLGVLDHEKIAETAQVPVDEVKRNLLTPLRAHPSAQTALALSQTFSIPLHPYHTYHWNGLGPHDIKPLRDMLLSNIVRDAGETKMVIPYDESTKFRLERIGVEHRFAQHSYIILENEQASILKAVLRLGEKVDEGWLEKESALECVQAISNIQLRDKSGIFIGARMGRPEKSKMRVLQGSPHVLFPVGEEGGRLRSFQAALEAGKITGDFPTMYCVSCRRETILKHCETCGERTIQLYHCPECGTNEKESCDHGEKRPYARKEISTQHYFNAALKHLDMRHYPDLIKGVRGTSNKTHDTEHLAKGILRAKYGVSVNKDGTTRYDMTQMPITHFKPSEIGTSVESLLKLGYTKDINGEPLTHSSQVLEMKPQDIILPKNKNAIDKGSHIVLTEVTKFIDDMLQTFYGCEPYYNVSTQEDLVGHIVMVLAPHTSGGISGRIIGFSETQGLFAHPMLHAGTRRDCDGDEACVCLLMDVLLNFSRRYLPAHRGATQDAPLVLTWKLTPAEVDDMVFNMDIVWRYPLEFYEAAQECKKPWDVDIEVLEKYLGDERQYEGFGYTHDITDMNDAVLCSAYKTLPTMQDKLTGQMNLAEKIMAVHESDVARLVIEKHFLKDIKGNLRKFSMQQFRCVNCNEKYRRPPLRGICPACSGKIIFTISEGSIVKYLEPSMSLARHYHLPVYLQQTLDILKRRVEGVFGKEKDRQVGLGQWFG